MSTINLLRPELERQIAHLQNVMIQERPRIEAALLARIKAESEKK